MRKILIVLLSIALLFVAGCSNSGTIDTNLDADKGNVAADNQTTEPEALEEVPIKTDEIAPKITILEPDSIGTVYMEATYTNNSEYPIVGYSLTVLLKDKNEKTYLSTHDTVMPGETSPNFSSFGPNTQNPDDYEMLKLEVTARTEEGNTLYIDYDFKLGEASWWESK